MVEGLWRHGERCDVAHQKVASTGDGPRFQEAIDDKVKTDDLLVASFQRRKQNAGSAAALEHSVSRAGSETLENDSIIPFMIVPREVEAVSAFHPPHKFAVQFNLFQHTRHVGPFSSASLPHTQSLVGLTTAHIGRLCCPGYAI
jgi:hypothetical protein